MVCWLRLRRSAMSRFVPPLAASCTTSSSRSVRPVLRRFSETMRARRPSSSLRRARRARTSPARDVPSVPRASAAASRDPRGAAVSSTCRSATSRSTLGRPAVEASSTIACPRIPSEASPNAASAATSGGTRTRRRQPVISSSTASQRAALLLGFKAAIQVSALI